MKVLLFLCLVVLLGSFGHGITDEDYIDYEHKPDGHWFYDGTPPKRHTYETKPGPNIGGESLEADSDAYMDEGPNSERFEREIRQFVEGEREDERRQSETQGSRVSFTTYPGTWPVEYVFARERQNPYPTNLIETTAHLIKGCMGAGALGMHEAFMRGGLWTSLVGTILIGLLVSYIMLMLVKSTHKMYARIRVPRLSYPDLAEAAVATGPAKGLRRFSKAFRYTVDTCLFMEMCGTCCLFELMIARTLKQALEGGFSEVKTQNMSVRMYVLIIAGPLLFLCMIRTLKCLAVTSLIAGMCVTICACGTTLYGITTLDDIRQRPAWKDYHGLFRFLGSCIYSLQGVTITLPLENNMRSPQHFDTVLQFGMVAVVLVIGNIGFFGYWSWGEQCESPITLHLPLLTTTVVLQIVLAVMMAITFVINFWIAFRITWYYVGKRHRRKRTIWQRFYKAIHVILISCVSLAFPDINIMMSFLGAVICSWVEFIFPAFIDSLVTWKDHQRGLIRWNFIRNICIMIFGGAIFIGAIVTYII